MRDTSLDAELDRIFAARDRDDMGPTIAALEPILAAHPDDARVLYEVGGAHDTAGHEEVAVGYYERALAAGLDGMLRRRCFLQYGSTLRNLGRLDESMAAFDAARQELHDPVALTVFEALTHHAAGRADTALGLLLELLVDTVSTEDLDRYAAGMRANARYLIGLDPAAAGERPGDE